MKYASKLIRCIAIGGIEWESSFWIAWDWDRYDQRFWLCDGLNSEADEMSESRVHGSQGLYTAELLQWIECVEIECVEIGWMKALFVESNL